MATIKGNPAAQLAYLEKKDAALRAKAAQKLPEMGSKAAKAAAEKRQRNTRLAAEIVAARLATARKNAQAWGVAPAKKSTQAEGK